MRIRKPFTLIALMFIAAVLVALPAVAQYGASLQGIVTDKSGAVVPNASVTVKNQATGVVSTARTSEAGLYRVAALPPGLYTVEVSAANFKKVTAKDVQVAAESVQGLNLTVEVGAAQETVTVTGEIPGVETETANTSGSIGTAQIDRLPAYGRDPYELVRLAPGTFGDGARAGNGGSTFFPNSPGPQEGSNAGIFNVENFVQVTANGQRPSGNNYTIDGTSVNSLTWGGSAIITPNKESVQEVTVVSSIYSAEDGRNSGAQVKIISKTGTNQLHGSAFFLYDEPGLNAYNRWGGPGGADPVRVDYKGRDFGGSIGGPIVKNKLFFFFSYEGNRVNNVGFSSPQYVETSQFRNWITSNYGNTVIGKVVGAPGVEPRVAQVLTSNCSDFNGQWPAYTGCQVVNGGVDLGSPALTYGQYVPTWTGDTTGGGMDGIPDLQKVILRSPSTSDGNQYNTRIDYSQGKNLFAFSGYYVPRNDVTSMLDSRANQDMTFEPRNQYGAFLWNRTFSPTLLNELRFNATRFFYDQYTTNSSVMWGLPYLEIEMLPFSRVQWGAEQGTNAPGRFAQNQFELRDVMTKTWGRHAFKFGGSFAWNQDNNNYEFGAQRPVYTFHGLWNFVNGAPIYEGINADPRTGAPTDDHKYYRQKDWAMFFQDDFRITPTLMLNLGLRYEYFAPLSEKYDKMSNLQLGTGATALQDATLKVGSPLYQADRNNFAPRLGFAWSPAKLDGKTVFRGGIGVSYNRVTDTMTGISRVNPPFLYRYGICCAMSNADLAVNGWAMPPFANGQIAMDNITGTNYTSIYNYAANPVLANNFDPATGLPLTGSIEIWGAPWGNRTPYVYNYSFDVQHEFPSNFVATLGFAGSQTRKLLRIVNENNIYQPNPTFFAVYFPTTDVNANYNSLNATLSRRYSNGVQMFAKYRWAKSMDTVSGEGAGSQTNQFYPPDQQWDYGPSDFDATHYFAFTGLYDIPLFKHRNDFLGKALGGWQLDGTFQFHSGYPWSAKVGNCTPVPSGNTICPSLVNTYNGLGGTSASTDTFKEAGGNFPMGGAAYFTWPGNGQPCCNAVPPFVNRNSFRGPRYSTFDIAIAKSTRLPWFGSENSNLDFRANFYNIFNKLNLSPFQYGDSSTYVTSNQFGQAQSALAGRVVDFQMRFTF